MFFLIILGLLAYLAYSIYQSRTLISRLTSQKKPLEGRRTFLVTGAASGIGQALALTLLKQNQNVIACDLNEKGLEDLPSSAYLLSHKMDVTDAEAWQTVIQKGVEKFSRIDVCLNVAGYLRTEFLENLDSLELQQQMARHFDINLKGVVLGTTLASQQMIRQGKDSRHHIINMGSMSCFSPVTGLSLYAASKAGVKSFTSTALLELKKFGISVSLVCPDMVSTPMVTNVMESPASSLIFSGKSYTAQEIADIIIWDVMVSKPAERWLPLDRGILLAFFDLFYDSAILRFLNQHTFNQASAKRDEFQKKQN